MTIIEKTRKAIERMYIGRCNIFREGRVTDQKTKLTKRSWEKMNENPIPCRLSFQNNVTAGKQDGAAVKEQKIEVFMSPEIEVPAGSMLEITQNGRTERYQGSGVPAVYATHQEIMLQKAGEWS